MTNEKPPVPKFSVGEIVQVIGVSGEVIADDVELIDRHYEIEKKSVFAIENGEQCWTMIGWNYGWIDYNGWRVDSHESALRKRPQPGIQSWDELMDSLPSVRDVETS